jgi:hypothetical protein
MKLAPLLLEVSEKYSGQVDTVWRSPDLVVLAPKTSKIAAKYSHNTEWCSQTKMGFCSHRIDEVLFRFLFKDGIKLRLNVRNGGAVGHWGGPPIKKTRYPQTTFSRDIRNIKTDGFFPTILVNKIKSIPDEAAHATIEYAKNNSLERSQDSLDVIDTIHSLQNQYKNLIFDTWKKYNEKLQTIVTTLYVKQKSGYTLIGEFSINNKGEITNNKSTNQKPIPLEKLKYWLGQQNKLSNNSTDHGYMTSSS